MHRARLATVALLGIALAAACGESGPGGSPRVRIDPILDSLFVGDTLPARVVTYLDALGDTQATGPVRWASSDTIVLRVDSVTGVLVGRGPGVVEVRARANGVTGAALLVVSRAVDLSLLLDTIYLMVNDTFTVPVQVRAKDGSPPPVWFSAASPFFRVDSATGLVTALFLGAGTLTAHADTVTASGSVEVVALTDTAGGKSSFSVLGSVIRRARAGARAVNYRRGGDTVTFRISLPVVRQGIAVENIVITLRDSVNAPAPFTIDSISLGDAFGPGSDFVCRPARPWALWSIQTTPPLRGLSRHGGAITITRVVPLANGRAVSGRFVFTGQRSDLYDDPLGALPIRGTFVAPLITDDRRTCGS